MACWNVWAMNQVSASFMLQIEWYDIFDSCRYLMLGWRFFEMFIVLDLLNYLSLVSYLLYFFYEGLLIFTFLRGLVVFQYRNSLSGMHFCYSLVRILAGFFRIWFLTVIFFTSVYLTKFSGEWSFVHLNPLSFLFHSFNAFVPLSSSALPHVFLCFNKKNLSPFIKEAENAWSRTITYSVLCWWLKFSI
jgi:hypothetical protein